MLPYTAEKTGVDLSSNSVKLISDPYTQFYVYPIWLCGWETGWEIDWS
jgi:hypothetical protein